MVYLMSYESVYAGLLIFSIILSAMVEFLLNTDHSRQD